MRGGSLPRHFWTLWAAAATSNIGDGIRLTALPLLMAAITRDPVVVSGVTAATFAPWVLFSLPGGALVDRLDRRRIMIWGQLTRGVVVGGLAASILVGVESVMLIYVTAFVIGLGEVFVDGSSQAAIPMLVDESDLESANSKLLAVEFVTNDALGGPVGAWLYSSLAALPFLADSASFLVAAFLVSQIRAPMQDRRDGEAAGLMDSIREGIAFVRGHDLLRGLAFAVGAANLAVGAGGSILVLLALDVLGVSEFGFGFLVASGAVGGFFGAVAARRVTMAIGRGRAMTWGAALLALGQAVMGTANNAPMAAVGFLVGSFGVSVFSVVGRSLRQAVTPDRILGRVVSTFRLIAISGVPVGAILGGAVAGTFGIRMPYVAGAVVMVGVVVAVRTVATEERIARSLLGRSG